MASPGSFHILPVAEPHQPQQLLAQEEEEEEEDRGWHWQRIKCPSAPQRCVRVAQSWL